MPVVRKRRLGKSIVLLTYPSQEALAKAFLRFQEFYECPAFRGKVFTLEEYRAWYEREFGAWTYYKDWSGFNVPGHIFDSFKHGLFDPLSPTERELLGMVAKEEQPYYVIGVYENTGLEHLEELSHELAHALFYTDHAYRFSVVGLLQKHDVTALLQEVREKGDYARAVLWDELQAYLIANPEDIKAPVPAGLRERLVALFEQHVPKLA